MEFLKSVLCCSKRNTNINPYEPREAGRLCNGTPVYVAGPNDDVVILNGKETIRPRGKKLHKDRDGNILTSSCGSPSFTRTDANILASVFCICVDGTEDDRYEHFYHYTTTTSQVIGDTVRTTTSHTFGVYSDAICDALTRSKEKHYKERLDAYHEQKRQYEIGHGLLFQFGVEGGLRPTSRK